MLQIPALIDERDCTCDATVDNITKCLTVRRSKVDGLLGSAGECAGLGTGVGEEFTMIVCHTKEKKDEWNVSVSFAS